MGACVTKHAEARLKERAGLNKSARERIAQVALEKGLSHNELTGSLKDYVTALYLREQKANNIKLYGDKTFLFHGSILITVIQTPNRFLNTVQKLMKRKEECLDRVD